MYNPIKVHLDTCTLEFNALNLTESNFSSLTKSVSSSGTKRVLVLGMIEKKNQQICPRGAKCTMNEREERNILFYDNRKFAFSYFSLAVSFIRANHHQKKSHANREVFADLLLGIFTFTQSEAYIAVNLSKSPYNFIKELRTH